jgi:hypothetical protein
MTREAVEGALDAGVEFAGDLLGNALYVKEELPKGRLL